MNKIALFITALLRHYIQTFKDIVSGMQTSYDEKRDRGTIFLMDNPITNPPLEIVAQGKMAVINYFHTLTND